MRVDRLFVLRRGRRVVAVDVRGIADGKPADGGGAG